jgi:hypothetical protein
VSPKDASGSVQPGKVLSRTETIAQLARRRAMSTAQAAHRRSRDTGNDAPSGPRTGVPAAEHKFRIGQLLILVPNRYGSHRLGRFKVVALLPQEHGLNYYRLKSTHDGHGRIAPESELMSESAGSPAAIE